MGMYFILPYTQVSFVKIMGLYLWHYFRIRPPDSVYGRCCIPRVERSMEEIVHQWRMQHLNYPALKKIHVAPLLEETLNGCITASILKNGFRKCVLVPWNPAAVDTSKIPTMDTGPAVTNRSSSERLRAGHAFLEGYIGKVFEILVMNRKGILEIIIYFCSGKRIMKIASFSVACKKIFKLMKVMAWIIQSKMVKTTMKKMKNH
ncbi:hypothetical protein PR048_019838, partial [Dryococelus australis]